MMQPTHLLLVVTFTARYVNIGGATNFILYTNANPSEGQELFTGDIDSLQRSNFNPNNPTKIIIHGWHSNPESSLNPEVRSAYLGVGDYNLISVGWGIYASLAYIVARYQVPWIGADLAAFIDFLNEQGGMSLESLVVIGESLGAHVAGYAGKFVTRGRLLYIVALDPASPLFSYERPNERLNSEDAEYVMSIHTNGGMNGFLRPIGRASFYANGGRIQPGCGLDTFGACSHARAYFYYADGISGYKFAPVKYCVSYDDIVKMTGCNNTVPNLDIADPTEILKVEGIFYFRTYSEEPFGHD